MKILLVTEKFNPHENDRDGGSRLAITIAKTLGSSLKIMQFAEESSPDATWQYKYPTHPGNRFEKRLLNAAFIKRKLIPIMNDFSIIIFIHISMQFDIENYITNDKIKVITFPMFLTPSYRLSGEVVHDSYFYKELSSLKRSNLIITPSYLEKKQLIEQYSISEDHIRVIPRGIDNSSIQHILRFHSKKLKICSIGSIKPQKNTHELIDTYKIIHNAFPQSSLKIIGPIQNTDYFTELKKKIEQSNIGDSISILGHIAPHQISTVIKDEHIHLSTSSCETFGRAIFETLAMGLPNIIKSPNNAAYDFLSHLPYVFFIENTDLVLDALQTILEQLPRFSLQAAEIGTLYCDKFLSNLLVSEITSQPYLSISDYDGTLYHKNSEDLTKKSINTFKKFQTRIICTARKTEDIIAELAHFNLTVDWIISYSGAVVTTGTGKKAWTLPIEKEVIKQIMQLDPSAEPIYYKDELIQLSPTINIPFEQLGLRAEHYNKKTYLLHRHASKLHSAIKLLKSIKSKNRIRVFGDGLYDREMLFFFDGLPSLKGVNI